MRPSASETSRRYTSPRRTVASTEPSTRSAGKNVRIEEYAEALAVAKASCSKARQTEIRNRRQNRPRAGATTSWPGNGSGLALRSSGSSNGLTANDIVSHKSKGRLSSPLGSLRFALLRGQFFGFAFVTHEFERTLGLLVGLRDFLLHLLRGLFHFRREAHVAIVLHAGAGGDQTAHDHVFLQTAQVVHRSLNGGFGEHARGLLERRG